MQQQHRSVLRDAALISNLLTEEQIEEAVRAACEKVGDGADPEKITDEQLGHALIKAELLNMWQVEQLRAGRTKFNLGPYQIIDSLGRGGMGHVFMAVHSMLGRVEAIKVLPKSKSTAESIENFRREIRAQAQLNHPNLVRVSYADRDGSTYFFVTEFVPGTDLRKLVRRYGHLSMGEAATIAAQAADALDYAHRCGLIHRDVKPGNLLVTPDGHTKVTDLGLAWYLTEESEEVEAPAGRIVGTADYLAPETIREPGDVRPVSDIYSLGCTLYYAVTGKVPFPGGTTSDKLRRHCRDTPLHPRRLNSDLDEGFIQVLADMMEKDPGERIPTAADVVKRLMPWTLDRFPSDRLSEKEAAGLSSDGVVRRFAGPVIRDPMVEAHHSASDVDHSQASQGTVPVASSDQETKPMRPLAPLAEKLSGISDWFSKVSALIGDWMKGENFIVQLLLAVAVVIIAVLLGVIISRG